MTAEISPSLLAADLTSKERIQAAITHVEKGADHLHIDVMDGRFVTQTTIWNDSSRIKELTTTLPLDVHLMIENPDERYLEFVHAGAKMLSFHIEAAQDPEIILSKLHEWDVKAGLVINPETPVENLYPYLPLIDYILVMSVHPGKTGQRFIPDQLVKVMTLKKARPDMPVEIDGGITVETAPLARTAGADIIVAGAAIFHAENPEAALIALKEAIAQADPSP